MDELRPINVTKLRRINNPKGDILHGLKAIESDFSTFGEAYFSTINKGDIKGWKKHLKMDLNLIVPIGNIRFVIYDERQKLFNEEIIGESNYARLHVPAGYWMAFQGMSEGLNMLLNIASIMHDPVEAESKGLDEINYIW